MREIENFVRLYLFIYLFNTNIKCVEYMKSKKTE